MITGCFEQPGLARPAGNVCAAQGAAGCPKLAGEGAHSTRGCSSIRWASLCVFALYVVMAGCHGVQDEGLEDKQANAVKRKKKKKNRKKKKTSDEGSPQHSRSPSPDWGRSAGAHRPSFSALTSAYRPHSAQAALPTQPSDLLRNSRYTSVPSRGIPCSSSSPMAW